MKASRFLLAALIVAIPAFAQQNVDISGKDFESGAGDAKFATLGRQAAASGKRIVVTAPQEWHGKIAAKIRAGGGADVVLKDGFYENVLVRIEDKPVEPPKVELPKAETPRVAAQAEPRPAQRATVTRVPLDVPGPKPTLPPPAPPVVAAAPLVAATPPPIAKAPPATATSASAKVDTVAVLKRMETGLNGGRAAEGPISVAGLVAGDFIFVDGDVRAVVRRESLRPRMFWLDGELDLRRAELKELGSNRYQVIEPIRGENYSVRDEHADQAPTLSVAEPPDNSPVRATFERDYNGGHSIGGSLAVEKLRVGDVVYTGKGVAVVVRREGQALTRFWLDGSLDLGQAGLLKDGANKYKVISDTIH